MRSRFFYFVGSFVVCCLALSCLPGCGKSNQKATVKGKVVFNNQPLTAGTVAFVDASGRSGSSRIESNGTYTVNDAPVGVVTVTVFTPPPSQIAANQGMAAHKGMPKEFLPPGQEENKAVRVVPAPEKYQKVETSTLKYTVQPGSQEYNIDLTP